MGLVVILERGYDSFCEKVKLCFDCKFSFRNAKQNRVGRILLPIKTFGRFQHLGLTIEGIEPRGSSFAGNVLTFYIFESLFVGDSFVVLYMFFSHTGFKNGLRHVGDILGANTLEITEESSGVSVCKSVRR